MFEVAIATADLDAMPEDTLLDIELKSAAWEKARQDETRTREELRANLFVGAFFSKESKETQIATVPHTEDLNRLKIGMPQSSGHRNRSRHSLAHPAQVYSLAYLAFAEIMQCGGFDVVLGNPPWERFPTLLEEEYFATRARKISIPPQLSLVRRESGLYPQAGQEHNPVLAAARRCSRSLMDRGYDESEATSQSVVDSWTISTDRHMAEHEHVYALFAETILATPHPTKGRKQVMIVPTGIATDKSTKSRSLKK